MARFSATTAMAFLSAFPAGISASSVTLATFDGAAGTTFKFEEDEDPIMGSESYGNWTVDTSAAFGTLSGIVRVVDRPAASLVGASPGFIKTGANGKFPDASSAAGGDLVLELRSGKAYGGFHVAVATGSRTMYACRGGGHIPLSRGCFKAAFSAPSPGSDFETVRVPLASFTDQWSPKDGKPHKTCEEDASSCLTANVLSNIDRIEVVAEAEDGEVSLEIKSISVEKGSAATVLV